jgi:hypothetical protein
VAAGSVEPVGGGEACTGGTGIGTRRIVGVWREALLGLFIGLAHETHSLPQ